MHSRGNFMIISQFLCWNAFLGACRFQKKTLSPIFFSYGDVQLQTNKFQGYFKDKLQFSRTKIYLINRHCLTPFDQSILAKTRHGIIYDFYFFGRRWSHYFILLSATRLCKMRYRNSIWNQYRNRNNILFIHKNVLRYPLWVLLQVLTPRMSQVFLGKIIYFYRKLRCLA